MKHIDLFSGIGGFALAASWVWGDEYENVGHCEIEEYACKVYHRHFPTSPHLGDITKVKWNEGQADIITGGFPCQPHSQAGKRLASKDERDLWYECKRAVSEIRPRYALFENVAGLLTSERGRFFNRVLSDLAEIGYDAEWHNIPASKLGAPHRRERIWIIAYRKENRQQGIIEQWENNRVSGGGMDKRKTKRRDAVRGKSKRGSEEYTLIADSESIYAQGLIDKSWERQSWGSLWREDWTKIATAFCRVDDGLSYKLDKDRELALSGLGNAIVPQVAQVILQAIKEADECSI